MFFFSLSLNSFIAFSQELVWSKAVNTATIAGNINAGVKRQIRVDNEGNVIVAGSLTSSPSVTSHNFGDGVVVNSPNTTLGLNNTPNSNIYVAKYNSNGVCLWAKVIGGSGYDHAAGLGIDENNNIYVGGQVSINGATNNGEVIMFDGIPFEIINCENAGNNPCGNGFIAKWNSLGQRQWVTRSQTSPISIKGTPLFEEIAVSSGRVYTTSSVYNGNYPPFSGDILGLVDSYNANTGVFQWRTSLNNENYIETITTWQNDVIVGGQDNNYKAVLVKINGINGSKIWSRVVSPQMDNIVFDLKASTTSGNLYYSIDGRKIGSMDINGIDRWGILKELQGGNAYISDLWIDNNEKIYTGGFYNRSNTVSFGNGISIAGQSTNPSKNGFIAV